MRSDALVRVDPASRAVRRFAAPLLASDAVGLLALRHGLRHHSSELWADNPAALQTLLLVRDGDGQIEAFGAGAPEPAVRWLVERNAAVALAAPEPWRPAVEITVRGWQTGTVITFIDRTLGSNTHNAPRAAVRRLTADDETGFSAAAPDWALGGWRTFRALIAGGAAFGVPQGGGFAALAWILDETDRFDALAVFTAPEFRRLGLSRASATVLIDHVRKIRGKIPLWSASVENRASLDVAASLGFVPAATETILRWPAQTPLDMAVGAAPSDMM